MVDILGTNVGNVLGGIKDKIVFHINWVLILAIVVIIITIGIVIWVIYMKRLFKYKIVVFENIAGMGYQPTQHDTARIVKMGDSGEELLFLRKKKVYRTAYGRKMGINTFWFCVGAEGFWYNVTLGDLDTKLHMLDIEPTQQEIRFLNVAIRKNIQERYRKVKFMDKYGTILLSGLFMLIMVIGIFVLLKKMGEIAQTINEGIKVANDVIRVAGQIMNNIQGASGGVQVIPPA
jgi:hypothetical protein